MLKYRISVAFMLVLSAIAPQVWAKSSDPLPMVHDLTFKDESFDDVLETYLQAFDKAYPLEEVTTDMVLTLLDVNSDEKAEKDQQEQSGILRLKIDDTVKMAALDVLSEIHKSSSLDELSNKLGLLMDRYYMSPDYVQAVRALDYLYKVSREEVFNGDYLRTKEYSEDFFTHLKNGYVLSLWGSLAFGGFTAFRGRVHPIKFAKRQLKRFRDRKKPTREPLLLEGPAARTDNGSPGRQMEEIDDPSLGNSRVYKITPELIRLWDRQEGIHPVEDAAEAVASSKKEWTRFFRGEFYKKALRTKWRTAKPWQKTGFNFAYNTVLFNVAATPVVGAGAGALMHVTQDKLREFGIMEKFPEHVPQKDLKDIHYPLGVLRLYCDASEQNRDVSSLFVNRNTTETIDEDIFQDQIEDLAEKAVLWNIYLRSTSFFDAAIDMPDGLIFDEDSNYFLLNNKPLFECKSAEKILKKKKEERNETKDTSKDQEEQQDQEREQLLDLDLMMVKAILLETNDLLSRSEKEELYGETISEIEDFVQKVKEYQRKVEEEDEQRVAELLESKNKEYFKYYRRFFPSENDSGIFVRQVDASALSFGTPIETMATIVAAMPPEAPADDQAAEAGEAADEEGELVDAELQAAEAGDQPLDPDTVAEPQSFDPAMLISTGKFSGHTDTNMDQPFQSQFTPALRTKAAQIVANIYAMNPETQNRLILTLTSRYLERPVWKDAVLLIFSELYKKQSAIYKKDETAASNTARAFLAVIALGYSVENATWYRAPKKDKPEIHKRAFAKALKKQITLSPFFGKEWIRADWFSPLFALAGKPDEYPGNKVTDYLRRHWILGLELTDANEIAMYEAFLGGEFLGSIRKVPINPMRLVPILVVADIMEFRCEQEDLKRAMDFEHEWNIIFSEQDPEVLAAKVRDFANDRFPTALLHHIEYMPRYERYQTMLSLTGAEIADLNQAGAKSKIPFYCVVSDAEDVEQGGIENPFLTLQQTAIELGAYVQAIDEQWKTVVYPPADPETEEAVGAGQPVSVDNTADVGVPEGFHLQTDE